MRNKDDQQLRELINNETIALFQDSRNDLRLKAKSQILKLQPDNKKTYNLRRKPERLYNVGDMVAIKRTPFGGGLKRLRCPESRPLRRSKNFFNLC